MKKSYAITTKCQIFLNACQLIDVKILLGKLEVKMLHVIVLSIFNDNKMAILSICRVTPTESSKRSNFINKIIYCLVLLWSSKTLWITFSTKSALCVFSEQMLIFLGIVHLYFWDQYYSLNVALVGKYYLLLDTRKWSTFHEQLGKLNVKNPF